MSSKIWLRKPALSGDEAFNEGWNHAFPIGNGSIGAMVYGDPVSDILQLNEETVWVGGGGRNRVNPRARESWKKVRELLLEGRIKEAEELCKSDLYAIPDQQRYYDTCGHIRLNFSHKRYSDYRRELDLENAILRVTFKDGDNEFLREYFVSYPEQVICVRQTSLSGERFNCRVDISERDNPEYSLDVCETGSYVKVKQPEGGCEYALMMTAEGDGCIISSEKGAECFDCTELTIYITIRSDYHGDDVLKWCAKKLCSAQSIGFDIIRYRHIADYKEYFDRVSLRLDGDNFDDIPTDERLKNAENDPQLAKLYFDFGRYLLISCSRPGTKPANLQGIWNKDHTPPWGCKYTININTEMNYWPAGVCGLSELELPLFDHLRVMLPYGKKVARDMYGLNGFCAHHNTDLFGDCAPQDMWMPATVWPMGAAWLLTHIRSHYEFTGDQEFLAKNIDMLKEACRFFTEYLFERDGKLITGPSTSPENTYLHPSGESGSLCVGPTMDSMIVREIFESCLEYSKLLGLWDELCDRILKMLPKIPKPAVGKYGQIMEWSEDYDEVEPGHRHISHLWGLHPSNQLTYSKTPELMGAARVTLERRLANGGGHTGWSRAWIINMWARLRDGKKVEENIVALLKRSTYPNFLDMHPPFQIDGNFGGTAGIAEALLQSHDGVITLLPALPDSWKSGEVRGLRARGGISVDMKWSDCILTSACLHASRGGEFKVSLAGKEPMQIKLAAGESIDI